MDMQGTMNFVMPDYSECETEILNYISGPITEELYLYFVEQLMSVKGFSMMVAYGLTNPNCPPCVLELACQAGKAEYRFFAMNHPNCPEGAAAYAFLLNTTDSHKPHVMYSTILLHCYEQRKMRLQEMASQ